MAQLYPETFYQVAVSDGGFKFDFGGTELGRFRNQADAERFARKYQVKTPFRVTRWTQTWPNASKLDRTFKAVYIN